MQRDRIAMLVAAKYQIVVTTMLFGAAGIAAAVFLALEKKTIHQV